jgi:hypothetical protein
MSWHLLAHVRLWLADGLPTAPPPAPIATWWPHLAAIDGGLFAAMLAACALLVVGLHVRAAAWILVVGYALACTFDQVRWQPHFVINPVVLLIVTAREPEREVLRTARLAIARCISSPDSASSTCSTRSTCTTR